MGSRRLFVLALYVFVLSPLSVRGPSYPCPCPRSPAIPRESCWSPGTGRLRGGNEFNLTVNGTPYSDSIRVLESKGKAYDISVTPSVATTTTTLPSAPYQGVIEKILSGQENKEVSFLAYGSRYDATLVWVKNGYLLLE